MRLKKLRWKLKYVQWFFVDFVCFFSSNCCVFFLQCLQQTVSYISPVQTTKYMKKFSFFFSSFFIIISRSDSSKNDVLLIDSLFFSFFFLEFRPRCFLCRLIKMFVMVSHLFSSCLELLSLNTFDRWSSIHRTKFVHFFLSFGTNANGNSVTAKKAHSVTKFFFSLLAATDFNGFSVGSERKKTCFFFSMSKCFPDWRKFLLFTPSLIRNKWIFAIFHQNSIWNLNTSVECRNGFENNESRNASIELLVLQLNLTFELFEFVYCAFDSF